MVGRITEYIQGHDDVHHGGVNAAQPIAITGAREHPLFGFVDGTAADGLQTVPFPELEQFIEPQEEVSPGESLARASKFRVPAGQEQLLEVESFRNGPPWVGRMYDRERNDDGPGPGRHLVDEIPEQHDLRRNGRAILPWIEIEEAQIHLHVTVSGLDPAQRQDAFPGECEPRVIEIDTGNLERKIGLHGGAEVGWTLGINIEPAIRQLPR